MSYIDTERLITEVRLRELLWDKGHVLYKDRHAKLKAWEEVCTAVCPNFDVMSPSERKNIDKIVQQRWRTARDAYTRSRAAIANTKSGSGGGEIKKKYIYYDHMQFLNKKHTSVEPEDSLTEDDSQVNISVSEPDPDQPVPEPSTSQENTSASIQHSTAPTSQNLTSQNKMKRVTKSKRSREEADFDKQMMKMFKENCEMLKNDEMAFFTSLLPITNTFSLTQKLTFRSEVLKIAMMIHSENIAPSRPQSSIMTYTSPESHSCHSPHVPAQESEQQLTNYFSNILPGIMVSNEEQPDQASGTTDFSELVVFKQN